MKIKEGARVFGISTEVLLAVMVANDVWKELGVSKGIVITSCLDGKHKIGSKHYTGHAIDIRTWNLPDPAHGLIAQNLLKDYLGPDYDIVLESDHLHVEFDPKAHYG